MCKMLKLKILWCKQKNDMKCKLLEEKHFVTWDRLIHPKSVSAHIQIELKLHNAY